MNRRTFLRALAAAPLAAALPVPECTAPLIVRPGESLFLAGRRFGMTLTPAMIDQAVMKAERFYTGEPYILFGSKSTRDAYRALLEPR